MEDPYTELARAIIRLKEEIIELNSAVLELIQVVKANTDEIDAIHSELIDR